MSLESDAIMACVQDGAHPQQAKLGGREIEALLAASREPDHDGHPELQDPSWRCHSQPAGMFLQSRADLRIGLRRLGQLWLAQATLGRRPPTTVK